jgi:hypothetical protein
MKVIEDGHYEPKKKVKLVIRRKLLQLPNNIRCTAGCSAAKWNHCLKNWDEDITNCRMIEYEYVAADQQTYTALKKHKVILNKV